MTSAAPSSSRGGALVLAGVSHHTAHVAVREPLAAACGGEGEAALRRAVRAAVGPAVTLVTCNRLEIYAWAPQRPARAAARLQRLLAAQAGVPLRNLRPHVFARSGVDAVEHLIRVASGLDSLALGECQIIGQVREAFLAGAAEGPLGPQLHLTFQHALEAGRRVRQLGGLDRHPSVAAIAVHVAAMELGTLRGKEVAVLGAGVTGKAAALALAATGVARIHLLNRSPERAAALAASLALGERAVPGALDDLPHALAVCDAVVCATAATRPVVLAGEVARAVSGRGEGGGASSQRAGRVGRPLVLVDIAVPRDVEGAARDLPGVSLIDLDDLEARCALDPRARRQELERVERAARAEAESCAAALRARAAVPDIVAFRRRAAAVRAAELRRYAGRLAGLSPAQRDAVQQLTHAIVQKLLHAPTVALRRSGRRDRVSLLEALLDPVPDPQSDARSQSDDVAPDSIGRESIGRGREGE